MDVILATADGRDEMFINYDIDIEVGGNNTFEIAVPYGEYDPKLWQIGKRIYVPDTEFGGLIGEIASQTDTNMVYVRGYTWRGMVAKKRRNPVTIVPVYTNGAPLGILIYGMSSQVDERFDILEPYSTNYPQIWVPKDKCAPRRAANVLQYYERISSAVDYKFTLNYEYASGDKVIYTAQPIVNYSTDIEFSEDENIRFTITQKKNGVNYLWCLGSGTGVNRVILLLHVKDDGKIEEVPGDEIGYFTARATDMVEVFDFPNAEDAKELKKYAIEHLAEMQSKTTMDAEIEDINVQLRIGDYVSGRDYITGLSISRPITRIIYKRIEGEETIEYSIDESYAPNEEDAEEEE